MKKLAIVTTHPIQYNAPWFRLLAERNNIDIKVFYTWSQSQTSVKDRDFGKEITWDIPLLEGYEYEFVPNISKKPGSHHFMGINCPSLISKIKDYNADALLVFGWNFISHFQLMRFFKGKIPVWFRGDSTLLGEIPGFKTALRRQVLTFVYRSIDRALHVGQSNKAYFLKHGLKEDQLTFAPHAVDNQRFQGDGITFEIEAKHWRAELGYHENDLIILFVGKLESKKQPEFLLKAVQIANTTRKVPLKLLYVGTGKMESDLKALAQSDDNIQFQPFQNQSRMPIVYRLGTILCLPSKGPGETWGLAVNEAMASGIPAMVSDKVGCGYDLIHHGVNGFIFDHSQMSDLISLLEKIDVGQLEDIGLAGGEDIKAWSFLKLVSNIETVINNELQN